MKEYYCTICGRKHDGKHSTKYCKKHQNQIEKYGKTLDTIARSKFDPNEFRFLDNNIVEFDTYKTPSFEVDKTYIIDAEDYPLVSKYKWRTDINGYACSGYNSLRLHRLLLNCPSGQQVDHINLNIYDNRKSNLRICNNSLNSTNRIGYNQLKVKGVQYHSHRNTYSAYIRVLDKQYHSQTYKTIEEAAFARYILEQMFVKDYIVQHNIELINKLSVETKQKIIDGLLQKFNKQAQNNLAEDLPQLKVR